MVLQLLTSLDRSLFLLINASWTNQFFDLFFVTITNGRFWIIPGIIVALIYLKFERRRGVLVLVLAVVTVTITDQLASEVFKPLVHRLRPCNPLALVEGGRFLIGYKTSFSFPSNHAMNMFGQAMLLTYFYPRKSPFFFIFAGFIAYSRVYVGVHYPLDVICGAILGILCGAAVGTGYKKISFFFRKRVSE